MEPNHTSQSDISVALLDAHTIVRDGLECLIERSDGLSVVGSVDSASDLQPCLELRQVDVVVMGLLLDGVDALRCLSDWSQAHPETKFLVLSQLPEDVYAERVLNSGGAGYLLKSVAAPALLDGIRRAAEGELVVSPTMASYLLTNFSKRSEPAEVDVFDRLTDRELHVLSLIGQGHATAHIATQMGISRKTVSTFKERIKFKLSLSTSQQLMQAALQRLGRFQ